MFISTKSHSFNEKAIKEIEAFYGAKHMGPWCLKNKSGDWANRSIDIFYQPNPDVKKGHKHYFGLFNSNDGLLICDGTQAFSEPIYGVLTYKEEVIVSRFRHDFIQRDGVMVDGGRDYFKRSHPATEILVEIKDGEFILSRHNYKMRPIIETKDSYPDYIGGQATWGAGHGGEC